MKKPGFTTLSLNVPYSKDDPHKSLQMPLYETVAFEFDSAEQIEANFKGEYIAHVYSRASSPTVEYFEQKLKTLTGANVVLAVSSGMAAVSNTIMAIAGAGDNIISGHQLFGHTYALFDQTFAGFGLETRFSDLKNETQVEALIDEKTRAIYFETVTNPQLEIADIEMLSKIAKKHKAMYIGAKPTKKWLEQRYSSAYLRDPLMDLGIMTDTLETAVMWNNLLPLWKAVRRYLKSRGKTVAMVHISHVYENGANLYFTFLSPMKKGDELEDYKQYHQGIIETIRANNGSLSHHHGVGRTLAPWMEEELGTENMQLMQAIKNHLDPKGIMNPGNALGLES